MPVGQTLLEFRQARFKGMWSFLRGEPDLLYGVRSEALKVSLFYGRRSFWCWLDHTRPPKRVTWFGIGVTLAEGAQKYKKGYRKSGANRCEKNRMSTRVAQQLVLVPHSLIRVW